MSCSLSSLDFVFSYRLILDETDLLAYARAIHDRFQVVWVKLIFVCANLVSVSIDGCNFAFWLCPLTQLVLKPWCVLSQQYQATPFQDMWFQDMLEHDLKFILRSKVYDLDQALLSSAIGTCGQILTLNTSGYLFVIFRSCGSDMK